MATVRTKKMKYGLKELERDLGPISFGDHLKSYRIGWELSQVAMARKLKISRQKLNDFEHERRFPSLGAVVTFAKRMGEHPLVWVQILLEDMLHRENLNYKVTLAG